MQYGLRATGRGSRGAVHSQGGAGFLMPRCASGMSSTKGLGRKRAEFEPVMAAVTCKKCLLMQETVLSRVREVVGE